MILIRRRNTQIEKELGETHSVTLGPKLLVNKPQGPIRRVRLSGKEVPQIVNLIIAVVAKYRDGLRGLLGVEVVVGEGLGLVNQISWDLSLQALP